MWGLNIAITMQFPVHRWSLVQGNAVFCGAVWCGVVQCSAVKPAHALHITALHCTAQCGICGICGSQLVSKQYSAVQCSSVQCSSVQCSAVQCSVVWCSPVWCSAVSCSAVCCTTHCTLHYTLHTALINQIYLIVRKPKIHRAFVRQDLLSQNRLNADRTHETLLRDIGTKSSVDQRLDRLHSGPGDTRRAHLGRAQLSPLPGGGDGGGDHGGRDV
jgi:hypothetical protein